VRRPASLTLSLLLMAGCSSAIPASTPHGGHASSTSPGQASQPGQPGPVKVTATSMTWSLPRPISREVVLGQGNQLVIAGGLAADQTTTSGVFLLDPVSGQLSPAGQLATPVHDAAGAALPSGDFVFGGGAASTISAVQGFSPGGGSHVSGHLPQPRSDLVCAVVDGRAFLLGGYDGSVMAAAVLATSDGRTFTTVANLPVPVRYPAVATVGSDIYLFGGEHSGVDTTAIQRIDPASGQATVVGHLPAPLAHASAATLGGTVVIAGGRLDTVVTDQILVFDPTTGRTRLAGHLPRPEADAGSAVLGGVLWLVGGEDGTTLKTVITVTA